MGSFLLRTYLYMYPGELSGAIISGTGWQPEAALRAGLALCRLEQLRIGETGCSKLLKELMFGAYNKKFRPNRATGSARTRRSLMRIRTTSFAALTQRSV